MAEAVISYDKDLPEIADRRPWEKPASYLVKDDAAPIGWREDDSGRRPSQLLLIPKIRASVDAWRDGGYEGASEVTRRLFEYWFEEDHAVPGYDVPFRYYFCQREAIETLAWLVEVAGQRDAKALIEAHGRIFQKDLLSKNVEFQTTMDGRRQIRRYVPELDRDGVQDLPPENLRRFAFKMATGSGKTWVIAMAVVWARFHKLRVPKSQLSTNFLIVAPNVIVYQRLEKDFANNRIFHELPLIPPEWKGGFSQKVILRGEATKPDPLGNLFLTNIHQLYESRDEKWTPENAGPGPVGKEALARSPGLRSALDAGSCQIPRGPRGAERRSPPCSRRATGMEPIAARYPSGIAAGLRGLARLFRHAQGPKRHVLPLDGCGLPAGASGGRPDRQGASHRHQGGRSATADRRPRQGDQGERGGEVRLLAASRSAAMEGALEGLP